MVEWLASAYPWIKALHIVSVMAWMAGLLYLPRLFVYHCDAEPGSVQSETFKVMERRLLKAIMTPAMVGAWVFGVLLLASPGAIDFGSGWIHVKLALVLVMSALHGAMVGWLRGFAAEANRHTARFYRFVNEAPTVLMVVIVLLAVVKPF
ncbi:MAG: protoporphyrinogen oxidase HemJ [Alphaproteobacteria bacterium]|jgi:putative membrane protein|nr:protoporphyrinogen oxidase HemJ [Alphaproteobacteria bacterium]|tara:strand:+ start:72 stop:521 length:450 start_codon:yes stop_codon:yes gene_type:complete